MNKKELKDEFSFLPKDQLIELVDQVLKTFDPSDPDVDKAWLKEARRQLREFKEGRPISKSGDEIIHGPEPMPPKVTDVQPLNDYKLRLRFENEELCLMDMKPFMIGVFKRLEEQEFFNQVSVLEGWGGITWPGELDLSPGMLRYNSILIQEDE